MPAIADLARSDDERQSHIVDVLVDAFEDLIERDPRAFRGKFRKMAADPFAFYRGSAPLFYSDVDRLDDPWVDDATARVWIQGDLHAENYGTYMDSAGVLVFDVNDFDEAYLGHYTWDLQRMAASLALLGFRKALSDDSIARLIEAYARAYVETVRLFATSEVDREFRLTLDNTEGILHDVLEVARMETRIQLLGARDDHRGRRPPAGDRPGRARARRRRALGRVRGLRAVPGHDPGGQAPAEHLVRGQGRRRPLRVRDRQRRAARLQPAGRRADAGAGERRRAVHEAGADAGGVAGRARREDPVVLRARGPPDGGLAGRAAGPRRPVGGLDRARRRRPGDQGALALRGRPRLGRRHRARRDAAARTRSRAGHGEGPLRVRRGLRAPAGRRQRRGQDLRRDRRPRRRVRPRPGRVRRRVRRADARGPPAVRRRVPQRDDPRGRSRISGTCAGRGRCCRRRHACGR